MLIFADIAGQEPRQQDTIQIDETLFEKIGEGDKDAFCCLYCQTKSVVYAYSLSILHNQMDAEDAMQKTVRVDFDHYKKYMFNEIQTTKKTVLLSGGGIKGCH